MADSSRSHADPAAPRRIVYPGSNHRFIRIMDCINRLPNSGHAQSRRRSWPLSTDVYGSELIITIEVDDPDSPITGERAAPARVHGLSKEEISRFLETSIYEKEAAAAAGGDGNTELCAVCQEIYREKEEVGVLGCRHRFHADCIGEWLQIKNVCPLCKCAVGLL